MTSERRPRRVHGAIAAGLCLALASPLAVPLGTASAAEALEDDAIVVQPAEGTTEGIEHGETDGADTAAAKSDAAEEGDSATAGSRRGASGTDTAARWRDGAAEAPPSPQTDTGRQTLEALAVSYGGAGVFDPSAADLFEGLAPDVPGDSRERTVTVTNSSGRPCEVLLACSVSEQGERAEGLLRELDLTVVVNDSTVHEGKASEVSGLAGSHLELGTLGVGQQLSVTVELSLPTSVGNGLALSDAGVSVSLEARDIEEAEAPTPAAGGMVSGGLYQMGSGVGLVAGCLAAVAAGVGAWATKRRSREEGRRND